VFSQIILEIRKEEDYRVPIWIIIGSTLGGLLLLSLLILALWKVMCPMHIYTVSTYRLSGIQIDTYIHTRYIDIYMHVCIERLDSLSCWLYVYLSCMFGEPKKKKNSF